MRKRKAEYERYMDSGTWRRKRALAFAVYGRRCAKCSKTTKLHVHHKTYERFGGAELIEDLQVLCEPCHVGPNGVHGRPRKQKPKAVKRRKLQKARRKAIGYVPVKTAPTKLKGSLAARNEDLHRRQVEAKARRERLAEGASK